MGQHAVELDELGGYLGEFIALRIECPLRGSDQQTKNKRSYRSNDSHSKVHDLF
jgi:hypothetical protein